MAIKLTETIFKDTTGTDTYNVGPNKKVLHGPARYLYFPPFGE